MRRRWTVCVVAAAVLSGGIALASHEQSAPRPLWREGFEASDRLAWRERQACCAYSFNPVDDRPRRGTRSGRFEVRAGNALEDGSARAQLAAPLTPSGEEVAFTEDMDRWFGWSMRLDRSYPTDPDRWTVLVAWKEDGEGQGPLKLSTSFERDRFRLEGPGGDTVYWRGPLVRDAWLDFVVRVKFSPNPEVGFVEVWTRGPDDHKPARQTLANGEERMYVRTMEPGVPRSYLKAGVYRDPDFSSPSVAWFDDFRIGRSFASVSR